MFGANFEEQTAMAKLTISMPDPMSAYVEARVKAGQYGNVSEYFRDLVRKDQAYHDKKEALVRALIEGEESGLSTRTIDEIIADARADMRHEKV